MVNRLEELRNARMKVDILKEEISDRIDDEEQKEALEDIKYHTQSKFDSPLEEQEAESSPESYNGSKGEYNFPKKVPNPKDENWDRKHSISENQEVEESEDMADLNVIKQIQNQHKYTPPSSKITMSSASPQSNSTEVKSRSSPNLTTRPTATSPSQRSSPASGSTGTRRRPSPRSAKGSTTSSPGLRSMRKSRPRASPPRRELIVVSTSKREHMEDYDHLEAM